MTSELEKLKKKIAKKEAGAKALEQAINNELLATGKLSICKQCNKTYEKKRKTQKFCSSDCSYMYWHGKVAINSYVITLTCPICKTVFTTTDGRKKYCNDTCYLKANRERASKRRINNGSDMG
jgi:hypothetical protein